MCDYIRTENIKTLVEHVVTKHLSRQKTSTNNEANTKITPSVEDVATPYVDTLTLLRRKYEENMSEVKADSTDSPGRKENDNGDGRIMQNEKAREDQVSFVSHYSSPYLSKLLINCYHFLQFSAQIPRSRRRGFILF